MTYFYQELHQCFEEAKRRRRKKNIYIYINTRTIEPNSPSKWNFTRFMYHGAGMFFKKQKVDTIFYQHARILAPTL